MTAGQRLNFEALLQVSSDVERGASDAAGGAYDRESLHKVRN